MATAKDSVFAGISATRLKLRLVYSYRSGTSSLNMGSRSRSALALRLRGHGVLKSKWADGTFLRSKPFQLQKVR
jgi:hypothetical protein